MSCHRHLHTPFAYAPLRQTLHDAAVKSVQCYLDEHGSTLNRTVHSEKEIQVPVAPGSRSPAASTSSGDSIPTSSRSSTSQESNLCARFRKLRAGSAEPLQTRLFPSLRHRVCQGLGQSSKYAIALGVSECGHFERSSVA